MTSLSEYGVCLAVSGAAHVHVPEQSHFTNYHGMDISHGATLISECHVIRDTF
jgi:hypothetical protein